MEYETFYYPLGNAVFGDWEPSITRLPVGVEEITWVWVAAEPDWPW